MTAGICFFYENVSEYASNIIKRQMIYSKIVGPVLVVEKQGDGSYYS